MKIITVPIYNFRRAADLRDVAALCVFLAFYKAKSISGQTLPIDNDTLKASALDMTLVSF
jgi:hypothetical protein